MKLRFVLALSAAAAVFPLTATAKSAREVLLLSNPTFQGPISTLDVPSGRVRQVARGWDASWSPNGDLIAFFSGRNLFVADRNGKHRRQLTRDVFPDFDAVWSPDGKHIAFLQQPQPAISLGLPAGFQNDIMIVDVATGVVTHLTHDRTARDDLAWSPDGTKLFFRTGIMGALTGADDALTGAPSSGLGHLYPIWSPNGRELVFIDGGNLGVADADGSNPRVLVHVDPYMCIGDPSWSPTGESLAFWEGECNSWSRIEIVDLGSGLIRPLNRASTCSTSGWQQVGVPPPCVELTPSWSPDGKWIAFTRSGRHRNVAVVHPNGRGLRVFAARASGSLLWEPNGN